MTRSRPATTEMARDLGLDDVVDHFTLIGDELDLLHAKSGSTRLGFAALLKFLLWRGRFPRAAHELPDDAVAHLARQVHVPAGELASFEFASRTRNATAARSARTAAFASAACPTPRRWRPGWPSTSHWSNAVKSESATS